MKRAKVQHRVLLTSDLRKRLSNVLEAVAKGETFTVRHYATDVALLTPLPHYAPPPSPARQEATFRQEVPMTAFPHVVALYNQAGGSGKTSVTRDVGYALHQRGFRVLLIDADQQASLSRWLGAFADATPGEGSLSARNTIKDVLEGSCAALPVPYHAHGLDLIVANSHLKNVELMLGSNPDLLGSLRRAVEALAGTYDIILIDTPPADNALVLACIAASDLVVVPVSGSKGLDNVDNVSRVIRLARTIHPGVSFGMFVLTGFSKNLLHDLEVQEALMTVYSTLGPTAPPITYRPSIFKDAPNAMQPVALYRPKNEAVQELEAVTEMMLARLTVQAGPLAAQS